MGKVILTEKNGRLLLFLIDSSGQPQMIQADFMPGKDDVLGNIYIGRVSEVVAGIHAAFVAIGEGRKVFLSLDECRAPLLVNREYDGRLKPGDEIVVQITNRALKSKLPGASTRLSLTGRYCVCKMDGHGVSYSGKLRESQMKDLKSAVKENRNPKFRDYGFIVRTNAGFLEDKSPLWDEMEAFSAIFDDLKKRYCFRTCYSCLYRSEPEIITVLKGIPQKDYEEIITDQKQICTLLAECGLSAEHNLQADQKCGQPADFGQTPVRFYQDPMLSLSALYSLETHLKRALDKRVWLSSGGYLVIEPTEAMVVIDVNSGKGSAGRGRDLYLQVNLEAAREIARQLRLRNYSGMIMVDFINMDSQADVDLLMERLRECLEKDKVKTRLVDMTALGIVEITRKKVSRPLEDFFRGEQVAES